MTRALGAALLVLLVLATLGEGGARPTVLLLTHGLAAGMLLFTLARPGERTLPWSRGPVALFLLFAAIVTASAVLGPYYYAAFLVLLEIGAFVTVAFLAARFGPGFPAFASLGLLLAAAVQSSWVLRQWIAGQPRPAGTFLNPSHLAAWLAAVLLLASGTRLTGWSARARVVLAAPCVIALFVAGSRGALLGLAAGIAVLLKAAFLESGRRARLGAAAAAFVVICVVAAGVSIRFREPDAYRYDRLSIWRASLQMTAESPLLGTGPGQFQDAAASHTFPAGNGPLRFEKYFTGTHSDLLRLPAELGIPAALALLLALALAVRGFLRGAGIGDSPEEPRSAMGAQAALLCLGVQALVENLSERPAVYLLAAALLGSLLSARSRGGRSSPRARAAFAFSIVVLFLVGDVSPYLAWSNVVGLPRGALALDGANRLARGSRHNPLHPDFDLRAAEAIAADGRSWGIEDYGRAREAAERAVRKSPRSAAYRVGLARVEALACGTLFRDQATRARARAIYEDAARLARHDALIPLEEALFLLSASDPAGARRAAERALALEPEAVAPLLVLAEAALAAGPSGTADAARLLDRAAELADRSRPFASASRYARQLLTLDEARATEIRRRITEAEAAKGGG